MDQKVQAYLATLPIESVTKLMLIRDLIYKLCPNIIEKMAYGIPSYYLNHPILHIAAFKSHVGIYPGSEAIIFFKNELAAYKTSEGTIRIPLSEALPLKLIEQIIRYNVANDHR